jgi:hypothetical protein
MYCPDFAIHGYRTDKPAAKSDAQETEPTNDAS